MEGEEVDGEGAMEGREGMGLAGLLWPRGWEEERRRWRRKRRKRRRMMIMVRKNGGRV